MIVTKYLRSGDGGRGRRPTTASLQAHVLHAREKASLAARSRFSRRRAAVILCPVATDPSHPAPLNRRSLAELTVRDAHGDLLEVQPLDLGPGTPATIALEHERGPQPHTAIESGDW